MATIRDLPRDIWRSFSLFTAFCVDVSALEEMFFCQFLNFKDYCFSLFSWDFLIRFSSLFIFVLTKLLAVLIFLLFQLHIVFYKLCLYQFVHYSIFKIYLIVIQNRFNKEDVPDMMVVLRETLIIRFIYKASSKLWH